MNRTEKGAAGGAAAGAAVGGLIGKAAGSTAKGAILGAVVGGAAGAAIGNRMDKQAEELDAELPNATVERVGEGIQITFDSGILFDVDSDVLRRASQENLSNLAQSIADYEGTRILVVGHTDSTGSDAYNQSLSERRANSARTYLLRQGVSADRIESVGRGESEPVAEDETATGRQENRRVEVAIFASEAFQKAMLDRYGRGG
jgi:outer membrane protein OmpA-like peptidoglycan-associated protein